MIFAWQMTKQAKFLSGKWQNITINNSNNEAVTVLSNQIFYLRLADDKTSLIAFKNKFLQILISTAAKYIIYFHKRALHTC